MASQPQQSTIRDIDYHLFSFVVCIDSSFIYASCKSSSSFLKQYKDISELLYYIDLPYSGVIEGEYSLKVFLTFLLVMSYNGFRSESK